MTIDNTGRAHKHGSPASTGGQYAKQATTGAASTLAAASAPATMRASGPIAMPEKLRDGGAVVLSASTRESADGIFYRTAVRFGGHPPERDQNRLTAASYDRAAALGQLDGLKTASRSRSSRSARPVTSSSTRTRSCTTARR